MSINFFKLIGNLVITTALFACGGGSGTPAGGAAATSPQIALQPESKTVLAGEVATFSVSASGSEPLSYQWKKGASPIDGATDSSYSTPVTTVADSGSLFSVTVSNAAGSVVSHSATLTVTPNPSIQTQPQNASVVAGNVATFSVVASGTAPFTYEWKKNNTPISTATGPSYTTPATTVADSGSNFSVTVTNAVGSVTSNPATLSVSPAPVAPSITAQPSNASVTAGNTATFSMTASGTAPMTYQWKKGTTTITGATGSSYTTPATTVADSGSNFSVTVTNAVGSVTSNPATLSVSPAPVAPSITAQPSNASVTAGNTATFSVTASGTALNYQWFKGTTLISGANSSTYTTPATTLADSGSNFSVTVTNAVGSVTSNAASLTVNALSVACSGPSCGASNHNTYSGSGIGVWRYHNNTASATTVNLDISGVTAGKQVVLAFTNGSEDTAASLPFSGSDASASPKTNVAVSPARAVAPPLPQHVKNHEDAHRRILEMNRESVKLLKTARATPRVSALLKPSAPLATPAVGATRAWLESGFTGASYPSTNQAVCALPTGRNVVFWKSNSDTQLTASILNQFTNAVCGTGKGFDKLVGLIGDVWGNHAYNNLITDGGVKQDINIVFLDAPANSGWAGYFWGLNNYLSSAASQSNQALVFFVNTNGIASDVNFYISTLIHEAKHMIGFYQDSVVRNKAVDTWYEETSAMMAEDIVSHAITGTNKIAQYRIPTYLYRGGNVSLNNWPSLSGDHYAMGGAFGAFLNRRYGTNLLASSVLGCDSGLASTSSYVCLNELISAAGGLGVADELARMGASAFSSAPGSSLPGGYGYPSVASNGYTLSAIDLTLMPLGNPTMSSYTSMTQAHSRQTIGSGVTRFKRNNVVVPANTMLYVVIR